MKLYVSPEQYLDLRKRLDGRQGDGTRETADWLRDNGFDPWKHAFQTTEIIVDQYSVGLPWRFKGDGNLRLADPPNTFPKIQDYVKV